MEGKGKGHALFGEFGGRESFCPVITRSVQPSQAVAPSFDSTLYIEDDPSPIPHHQSPELLKLIAVCSFGRLPGDTKDAFGFPFFLGGIAMTSSHLPRAGLLLISALFLGFLAPLSLAAPGHQSPLINHGGPVLHGNLNLGLIWYGPFGRVHKSTVRSFIKSLNIHAQASYREPQVSTWWNVVESYQSHARVPAPIQVRVVQQVTDQSFSVGKVITKDFLPSLIKKATGGNPNVVAVIFTNRDVTVMGLCTGMCYNHGVVGNQPYIIVGDPLNECPEACAWPFVQSNYGPKGVILQPPNGNAAADSMVVNLASALAATVTNPFGTGYYHGFSMKATEATMACPNMFGKGAFPGYTGKVRVDPTNGGGFNVRGFKGRKFLLPAIWNPRTATCWTPL